MKNNTQRHQQNFFQFIDQLEQLICHLGINNNSSQWASFVTEVNKLSSDDALIDAVSHRFDLRFMPADLKTPLPDGENYLVKSEQGWLFTTQVNHFNKNSTKVYLVRRQSVGKQNKLNTIYDLFLLKENRSLVKLFVVSFFINLFALTIPLYFNAIYGRIIPAAAESSLWTLSFIAMTCFLCELLLKKRKSQYSLQIMAAFKNRIQPALFDDVLATNNRIDNHWGGDKSKIAQDIRELNSLMWGLISTNVFDIFFVFLFLYVIFIMAGSLVIVPLLIFILQLMIGFYYSRIDQQQKPPYTSGIGSTIIDNHYINGSTGNLASAFFAQSEQLYQYNKTAFFNKQNLANLLHLLTSGQSILITIVAFFLIQRNDISLASLFAVVILSGRVSQSATGFIYAIPLIDKLRAKVKQIREFQLREQPNHQKQSNTHLPDTFSWSLQNTNFCYDQHNPLFSGINLTIKSGEKIAFVGTSGAGKTTLAKLLTGLIQPEQGSVSVLNSDGHSLPITQLQPNIHYIPQSPFLFGDTVIGHLCSEQEHHEQQCKEALSPSFLNWLPPKLNNGLYTKFSSLPFELSPAQKQMLLISRFLLTQRKIWVLDEPTALVDSKTERFFIQQAQQKLTEQTTLLLFADSANLFDLVDRVVAFNDGHIIFDGSKADFMQRQAKGHL